MAISLSRQDWRSLAQDALHVVFVSHRVILAQTFLVFLPILCLQLGAANLMRGRTSPVPGGALLGSVLAMVGLCFLTPIAAAASFRRLAPLGQELPGWRITAVLRTAWHSGLRVAAGLIAGFVPGLVLQVRYALAAQATVAEGVAGAGALARSAELLRGRYGEAGVMFAAAMVASLLGQSLVAGLGEVLGVVQPVAHAGSPGPAFVLDYRSYVVVTVLAYGWNVTVMALLLVALPLRYGHLSGGRRGSVTDGAGVGRAFVWPRWASWVAACGAMLAVGVLSMKLMQHG